LLSGGGTGGHVYPALAVVEAWKGTASDTGGLPQLEDILYIGTVGGLEADIVTRQGIAFCAVRAAGVRGMSLGQMLVNSRELLRGTVQAWRILRTFRPDVVLATGGYGSAPVVIAARLQGCPVLVYLPDVLPGWAIRFLSRLAQRVAVSFDASLTHFPTGKAIVTGYPVRSALYNRDKAAARQRLGLTPDLQTVLIFGGSRGAHSINLAVSEILERLLGMAQVIHITGGVDIAWLRERRARLSSDMRQRYWVYAYLYDEMVDALLAADLAVARAGAATMGEFAAVGLPSILVPYPYAGQHQEANADFMVRHGAALKVLDAMLPKGALWNAIEKLLTDGDSLRSMADNARKLSRPRAAQDIAQQLALLAGGT